MVRTRNWLWHDPRPFPVARKIAKYVLRDKGFRKAKRKCPGCKFDMLLVTSSGNIWCNSCGLMVPADSVYSIKTGRRVRF